MRFFLLFSLLLLSLQSFASGDTYEFDTEAQRLRYQQLAKELRCPKCQNTNLLDSNSEISESMRFTIAEMIQAGGSDAEIKNFMVERYSNFVLYEPPVDAKTSLLWAAPLIFFLVIAVVFYRVVRHGTKAPEVDDQQDLEKDL